MKSLCSRLLRVLSCLVALFVFSISPAFALEALPVAKSPYQFAGDSQADLFSGSVNYSYPIKVPKGVNDLAPEVSLSYNNSSAYSFFSSIGSGWQVSRDYVERDINFTPANGSTGDDKFKLHLKGATHDLVYVSGDGRYHTKTESNLHIQKLSSGQNQKGEYWQVISKDGTKYILGKVSSSELVCDGRDYVNKWFLEQVQDVHGNTISYTYTEGNGYSYLSKIEYNNSLLHRIDFNYNSIPSQRWQENQGCDTTEPYRLNTITVKTDNVLVRQYDVAFTQGENNQSLLTSITEKGSDASPLPATTFNYNPEVKSWGSKEVWIDNANIDTNLERPDTAMADVNGDGYLDIVKSVHHGGPNVSWWVFFNQGGNGWSTTYQVLINNVPMEDAQLTRSEVRLMDVTGDNLPDIVMAAGADHWYVWRNTGGNWNATPEQWADMRGNNSEIHLGNGGVTLVDMTGDGLPDIVWARWDGRYVWDVWRNTGNSWSTTAERWSDGNTSGSYNHGLNPDETMLIDANGDGLIDIVNTTHTGSQENSYDTWKVWRNTGSSFRTSNEVWINNANITAHLSINQVGVADVNGDNLPDIVKVIDQGVHDEWKVLLNKGNSWSTTYEDWIPYSANVDADLQEGENVIIADATGDGLVDVVKSEHDGYNATWEVYRNNGKSPKMLSSVKSPEGALTAFEYKPSTNYSNVGSDSKYDLPIPMWVTSKMTVDNGLASGSAQKTTDVTNYSYANGLYDWQDKEFRGFSNVYETQPNTAKKTYVFHQDDVLKSKLDRVETTDASNNLYATSKNTWSSSTANGVDTVNLSQEQEYTYDGVSSNPKITQTDYTYDSYGNVTKQSDQGDTSVSGDERFRYNEYAYNTTAWIVNTVKHTYKNAANDLTKVNESWLYYDGNSSNNDTPTKGNVTKEVKWLSGGTNPETTYAYDSYGNQTSVTDTNNHTTTQTYDSTHTYPAVKTNAKNQTITTTFDPGTGNLLSETEPNGLATTYAYDVFGRKTKDIKPYDSSTYPTTNYEYFIDGTAPEGMLISKRKVSSASGTLNAYTWTDGLQRNIQTRSDAENTAEQIVKDTFYDPTGEVLKETVPYNATLATTYATPSGGIRFTGFTYDPIGRVTIVDTPDNKTKTTTYDHWKATDIDENGHIKRNYMNAHGKIAKVEEVNGVTTYATEYEYNENDQLKKIIDDQDNENIITYDTLGRKISQDDPDMGTWEYEYDGLGNITKQTDNRNVAITKTYDELGRIMKTDYPTDTDVEYTYDVGKIGTLSIATDSAGTVKYNYDDRLRKTQEQRSVNGTTKTTQFSYDAADRTVTQTNPDGEVLTSAYNAQGELESLTGSSNIVTNLDYNAQNKITKKDFGNSLSTDYTYNTNDFRLNRIQTGSVQDMNYTYDNVGNIKTIANGVTSKTQTFSYDDLDRLKTASESAGGYNQAYEYNSIGNLTKLTNNGVETTYNYGENDKPHALTSSSEPSSSGSAQTATFNPTDDAYVVGSEANANFNSDTDLGTDATYGISSYMKYNLSSLAGKTVTNAKLRMYVSYGSSATHNVKVATSSAWTESTITYNNRPALDSTVVGSINNATTTNTWHEIDITSSVNANVGQLYTIGMETSSGDDLWFNGADAATNKVELVITYTDSSGGGPTATPTPTSSAPTPTPTPNVLVSEDWSSGLNTSIWSDWGGAQTNVVSNEFQISSTTSPNYYGIDLATNYDLTNRAVTNELVSAGNQSITSWEAYPIYMEQSGNSANGIYWYVTQNNVWIQTRINGTDTFIDKGSYNSTNQKHFRIRESSGTIYFETSPDGSSWTGLHSLSNPFAVTSMKIGFAVGTFENESTTTTATFDNFTLVDNTSSSTPTPTPGSSTPALVQKNKGSGGGTGSVATSFTSNVTTGNFIAVMTITGSGSNLDTTSVTDNHSNTYTQIGTTQHTSGNNYLRIWYAKNVTGGAVTVTAHQSGSASGALMEILEYSGIDTASPADQSASNTGTSTSPSGGSITPTSNNSLIISAFADDNSDNVSITGTSGYTVEESDLINSSSTRNGIEDKVLTTAGATTGIWTTGSSSSWAAAIVSFKPAGTPTTTTTPTPTPTSGSTATPTPTGGGGGTKTYTYDDNGNMTSDGTKCYHYNDANQMDRVSTCSNNQTIAEYVYDYTGLRMVKKNYSSGTMVNSVTSWSDGYETKFIVGGATENTAYYFANGQLLGKKDKDGNRTYVHSDHLGSTSVVTNQAGALVEATAYDPWGNIQSGGTANKYMYTGQEKDAETGLLYYNARYYDPNIRRFTQPDDIIQNVYNPQDLNRYSYARNNPVKYVDPTGHVVTCSAKGCYSSITILNTSKASSKPTSVAQFVSNASKGSTSSSKSSGSSGGGGTNSSGGGGGSSGGGGGGGTTANVPPPPPPPPPPGQSKVAGANASMDMAKKANSSNQPMFGAVGICANGSVGLAAYGGISVCGVITANKEIAVLITPEKGMISGFNAGVSSGPMVSSARSVQDLIDQNDTAGISASIAEGSVSWDANNPGNWSLYGGPGAGLSVSGVAPVPVTGQRGNSLDTLPILYHAF